MRFDKPLKDLVRGDIEKLIGEPEREDLEFKSELSRAKNGDPDQWYGLQSGPSDRSKHNLAREIVAFANRSGGTLVVGIEESDTRPSIALRVAPIPKPGEFAERLRRSLHAIIEPPLPLLNVVGIPTELDGSGVVVLQVGASASAPHRLNFKGYEKECYIRRNDECMPMDMRSIHDLVVERMRLAGSINETFAERARSFRNFANLADRKLSVVSENGNDEPCGGYRVTAVAMEPVVIADITSKREFCIGHVDIPYSQEGVLRVVHNTSSRDFRPVLRGWLGTDTSNSFTERLVSGTGFIEDRTMVSSLRHGSSEPRRGLYSNWLLSRFVNMLHAIETFRRLTSRPGLEFGLEFELRLPSNWTLIESGTEFGESVFQSFDETEYVTSQRLSVGGLEEFSELLSRLQIDLWNSFGFEAPKLLKLNIPRLFE